MTRGSRPCLCLSAIALAALTTNVFAGNGFFRLDLGGDSNDSIYEVGVAGDGRVYLTTNSRSYVTETSSCVIVGLLPDGVLLNTLGTGGKVVGASECTGEFSTDANSLVLTRSDTSGIGFVRRDLTTGAVAQVSAISGLMTQWDGPTAQAIQPDGKVLIAGTVSEDRDRNMDWTFRRFDLAGALDSSFAGGGGFRFDLGGGYYGREAAFDVAPLADGKFLTVGQRGLPTVTGLALLRFNNDGSPDSTFAGGAGEVVIGSLPQFAGLSNNILALDASGNSYVLGTGSYATRLVTRVSAQGVVDASYAGGTVGTTPVFNTLLIDSQGRAVLFGTGSGAAAVARFDTSGNPDVSFGSGGSVSIPLPAVDDPNPRIGSCAGALQNDQPVLTCVMTTGDSTTSSDLLLFRLTVNGSLDTTFGQEDTDIYPDAMTFAPKSVPYGTAGVVSDPITVTGINSTTSITHSYGTEYSIGCTGTFKSGKDLIQPNQTVCVRMNASATAGGTATGGISVGGRAGTFTVTSTNEAADTTPDPFTFTDRTDVGLLSSVPSDAVTITGITGVAVVTISGGQYRIGCDGGPSTSERGTITNGQTVCVHHLSSGQPSTTVGTVLTIGGVSDTFSSTTRADDSVPDAMSFASQSNVAAGATVMSNTVTISGINVATAVTVSGGEYSIECAANGFTSAAGTVNNGSSICLRHTASSTAGGSITTTLTVGGVTGTFTSTTVAASSSNSNSGNNSGGGGGALDWQTLVCLGSVFFAIMRLSRSRRGRAAGVSRSCGVGGQVSNR